MQGGLIVFDRQDVVPPARDDYLRNFLLTPPRLNGHNLLVEIEQLQYLRQRRDFIGFGRHGHLPQRDPRLPRPCPHHLQRF